MNPMHALEKRLAQTEDIHGEQSYFYFFRTNEVHKHFTVFFPIIFEYAGI